MQRFVITRLCTLLVALGFVGLLVAPASAAPSNAHNAQLVDLTCANGATYTIITNSSGAFSPGHLVDADGNVLIPVAFHFVGMNASGAVVFDDTLAKPGKMSGLSGDLVDCTFTVTDTDPDTGEIITVNGTVTLFVAPRT
jgi:hypothetical protein